MKPEKQRIAIAEACGISNAWDVPKSPVGAMPYGWLGWAGNEQVRVPDYLNDLNAMHEAEKTLTRDQRISYTNQLCRLLGVPSSEFAYIHATAAQRAEAFLRTIGKWEKD